MHFIAGTNYFSRLTSVESSARTINALLSRANDARTVHMQLNMRVFSVGGGGVTIIQV